MPENSRFLVGLPGLRARAEAGEALFGNIDSWLIWNLCGRHVTDVTNASRTLLMDLNRLAWEPALTSAMGVPLAMLPEIRPSVAVYGEGRGPLAGPVVAASVILPADCEYVLFQDSKKLTEKQRDSLFATLTGMGIPIGVGVATPADIDEINILVPGWIGDRQIYRKYAWLRELPSYEHPILVPTLDLPGIVEVPIVVEAI